VGQAGDTEVTFNTAAVDLAGVRIDNFGRISAS
jgi:hypothetical protein